MCPDFEGGYMDLDNFPLYEQQIQEHMKQQQESDSESECDEESGAYN